MNEMEYRDIFDKTTDRIQKGLLKLIQESLHPDLNSSDQMGCVLIALTALLLDLSEVISNGTEKTFTFDDMITHLVGMKKYLERKNKGEV